MRSKCRLAQAAFPCLLIPFPFIAHSQEATPPSGNVSSRLPQRGINTAGMNAEHLAIWDSIRKIIRAEDNLGHPEHPVLHQLWDWMEANEPFVHIEFIKGADFQFTAGETILERCTPEIQDCRATVRIYLDAIKGAKSYVSGTKPLKLVASPGEGLAERCAEILGHELTHAYLLLEDPPYARIYRELEKLSAEWYSARRSLPGPKFYTAEIKGKMKRMQYLMDQLEAPALRVQAAINIELANATRSGQGTGILLLKTIVAAAWDEKSK